MFRKITVHQHERALVYRDGRLVRELEAGRHLLPTRASVVRVDIRERITTTAPQEVLTADGVSLRVTATILWRVIDARAFLERSSAPEGQLYLAVQIALRDALSGLEAEALLTSARTSVTSAVTSAAAAAGEPVGIAVEAVVLKDVILPGELRSAYAEVVTARQKGKAQLEAARAETAALRSLANGAKLLEDHPSLAKLRLVQALPYGSTLKVTLVE